MPIPDFESMVVARLLINNQEIQLAGGIKRAYALSPSLAPNISDFPLASVRVGAMKNTIPADRAGSVTVTRDYIIELPVASMGSTTDTANLGATALQAANLLFAIVRDYYLRHPRLQTDGTLPNANPLAALQYIHEDLLFTDGGMVQMNVPGGGVYVGTLYTLTISMRAPVTGLA